MQSDQYTNQSQSNEGESRDNLQDKIQNQIDTDKVQMIPKSRLFLQSALFAVAMSILFLGIIYLASLFLFILQRDAPPNISLYTLFMSLDILPALIFCLCIVGIIVIEILFRKYSVGYRFPALTLFIIVIALISFSSIFINKMRFHDYAHSFLKRNRFDLIDRRLYSSPTFRVEFRRDIIIVPRAVR